LNGGMEAMACGSM